MKPAISLAAVLLTVGIGTSIAVAQHMNPSVNVADIKWGEAPPSLPKGAQIAVISGDPTKDGLYVLRAKFPPNFRIAPHNHPTGEHVTVISGAINFGMGDAFDEKKTNEIKTGGYFEAPAKMNHFVWTTSETVVQIHGQGPFVITYVNPADDPSKK